MSTITDEMVKRAYDFYGSEELHQTDDWMQSVLEVGCGAEIERLKAALRVVNDALAAFCSHQLNHAENYALLGDAWKQTRATLEERK